MLIVGIAGKKGSGKSTAAQALESGNFEVMSFAYTLKLMARVLLKDCGLSEDQVKAAQTHKEEVIDRLGVSYRHLTQTLGTEWGRHCINENLWVMAALHRASRSMCDVVFDDVRFENEAKMIRDSGGFIIHISRDIPSDDGHLSECGIAFVEGDYSIVNNGDVDDLHDRVLAIMRFEGHR